ncbi:PEP-CTERM sorting domain-containing protein [Aeoliella sp.]|uniref:PEP-CTERM sorting domain-containing protein n=1 Tax=Aeoliella sp. TaxID=2795800 RepID=UPI003CCC07B5
MICKTRCSIRHIAASAIAIGLLIATSANAAVLIHESFSEMPGPTEDGDLNGYAGTDGVSEIGLTGTWALVDNNHRGKVRNAGAADWTPRGPDGGHVVDEVGGNLHFIESDNWGVDVGTRPLSSTVDFSSDGTWYMSFFSQAGGDDTLLQIGLSNATNELLWGNGYGNGNTSQGITAYHQALSSGDATNADGTFMDAGSWDNAFWVAKLEKTNSGTTDDVTVSIKQYNLTSNSAIDADDPASWTRVVSFGGVTDVFDTLHFKQSGGNGQFPGMDEFRLGESWSDVTGVVPEPSAIALMVLGGSALALLRRRA